MVSDLTFIRLFIILTIWMQGVIVAQDKMPSAKFQFPKNLEIIAPNQDFDIVMKISNLVTGGKQGATRHVWLPEWTYSLTLFTCDKRLSTLRPITTLPLVRPTVLASLSDIRVSTEHFIASISA